METDPSSPFVGFCKGTYSFNGFSEITTPAAWVLEWRMVPSRYVADFTILFMSESESIISFNSEVSDMAS